MRGGAQAEPRTLYIESVSLYQDDMPLPTFRPELIRNLPFPTTRNTILPSVTKPTKVALVQQVSTPGGVGSAFQFTAHGDEDVVWRYTPTTGTFSDLTLAGQVVLQVPVTSSGTVQPLRDAGDQVKRAIEKEGLKSILRAPASTQTQRGESPLQVCALRPVTDRNCVAVRRGGEQREVNDQSVG